jgi:hypothetical protein
VGRVPDIRYFSEVWKMEVAANTRSGGDPIRDTCGIVESIMPGVLGRGVK